MFSLSKTTEAESNNSKLNLQSGNLQPSLIGLEPLVFWKQFNDISAIPRDSGKEHLIRQHIVNLANLKNWNYSVDQVGNLIVKVPGRGKGEHAAPVALQSHLDMVCVAESGVIHDFSKDQINFKQENSDLGKILKAAGTTAGFDDGVGVASSLAIAIDDDVIDCPPLELIFTVEEETGLTGAKNLNTDPITSGYLINLDNGTNGIRIGCAGSAIYELTWADERLTPPIDYKLQNIKISGIQSGHSGLEIHIRKQNAIKVISDLLNEYNEDTSQPIMIVSITGGEKINAIPDSSGAEIAVPEDADFQSYIENSSLWQELLEKEPGIKFEIETKETGNAKAFSPEHSRKILTGLSALHTGVLEYNEGGLSELPLTSSTPAILRTQGDVISLQGCYRSFDAERPKYYYSQIKQVLDESCTKAEFNHRYAGWKIDPEQELVLLAEQIYHDVYGRAPEFVAPHSGIEVGVILERSKTLKQAVSLGPLIKGHHTPDEFLLLDTLPEFYNYLKSILHKLC